MSVECDFSREGDRWRCLHCGRAVRFAGERPPRRVCISVSSVLQRARNFTAASVKHVAAGIPHCTDAEIEARYTVCQGCEFLSNEACAKCGCPVTRVRAFASKLAWADQSCPIGKWGKIDRKSPAEPS